MSAILWLGWAGNACFFSRFLVQWAASERARRSVAPPAFWWISLAGSVALGVYTLAQAEPVLLVGYVLNGAIYARNLALQRGGARPARPARAFAVLALLEAAALVASVVIALPHRPESAAGWILCAALGQAIWSARFLHQWWSSERAGQSHLPGGFWWLSLAGNVLLLAYALHLGDAVLVSGYALGPLVQVRNLILSARSPASPGARTA